MKETDLLAKLSGLVWKKDSRYKKGGYWKIPIKVGVRKFFIKAI